MVRKKKCLFLLDSEGENACCGKNEQNGFYFTIIAQNYAI